MKVSTEQYEKASQAYDRGDRHSFALEAALDAAMADVPDVEPFTFPGYPDSAVYLHPCGTVVDVVPGSDMEAEVKDGSCDCEGGQAWMRIYVEKS